MYDVPCLVHLSRINYKQPEESQPASQAIPLPPPMSFSLHIKELTKAQTTVLICKRGTMDFYYLRNQSLEWKVEILYS